VNGLSRLVAIRGVTFPQDDDEEGNNELLGIPPKVNPVAFALDDKSLPQGFVVVLLYDKTTRLKFSWFLSFFTTFVQGIFLEFI